MGRAQPQRRRARAIREPRPGGPPARRPALEGDGRDDQSKCKCGQGNQCGGRREGTASRANDPAPRPWPRREQTRSTPFSRPGASMRLPAVVGSPRVLARGRPAQEAHERGREEQHVQARRRESSLLMNAHRPVNATSSRRPPEGSRAVTRTSSRIGQDRDRPLVDEAHLHDCTEFTRGASDTLAPR